MGRQTMTTCDRCGAETCGGPRGWMRIVQQGEVPDFGSDPFHWFCPRCTQSYCAWFESPRRVRPMEHEGTGHYE